MKIAPLWPFRTTHLSARSSIFARIINGMLGNRPPDLFQVCSLLCGRRGYANSSKNVVLPNLNSYQKRSFSDKNSVKKLSNPCAKKEEKKSDTSCKMGREVCKKNVSPPVCVQLPGPYCVKDKASLNECRVYPEYIEKKRDYQPPEGFYPKWCTECEFNTRLDELHYQYSDKAKRKYARTWNEFIACKPAKPSHSINYAPKPEKRPGRPAVPCATSTQPTSPCGIIGGGGSSDKCDSPKSSNKCPEVCAPFCRKGRRPPRCLSLPVVKNCKKVCAPFPSFSECDRCQLTKAPIIECHCLAPPLLCEIMQYYEKQKKLGKMK